MNLRILKKLSKRAAPLLRQLGDTRQQFTTGGEAGECSWNYCGFERKSYERVLGHRRDWLAHLDGIHATGATTGYYEPEWDDEPCWIALRNHVVESFGDWREVPGYEDESGCPRLEWVRLRRLPNPSAILRAVPELIEARRREEEKRKTLALARRVLKEDQGAACDT